MTKKYKTNHPKEHQKQVHCPICNRYKAYNERYPNYVCIKCTQSMTDKGGLAIAFYNITTDGHGCQGKYVIDGKLYRGNICYLKGIKCVAEEAYMGGIVIRPYERKRKAKQAFDETDATSDFVTKL